MSIYNEDEWIAPSWINKEFIQKVLNHYENTYKLKLIDFDISPASLKGDHYGIIMFRYKVNYELNSSFQQKHTRNFIIKTFVMGLSKENAHFVTKYNKGLFCNSIVMTMDLIRNGIGNFITTLEEYEEFAEYLPKFKAIQPNLLQNCIKLYNAYNLNRNNDSKDINVLNHGDFHLKNLMFKFNKNSELEDVIMVDYQMNCYAPSTIDTTYSQYFMMSPKLRSRRNDFMHYYFTEFIRILKKLNYEGDMPLYSDFQISSYKYKDLALFLLSTFLPMFDGVIVSKAENLKDLDSSNLMEDQDLMISVYKRSSYLNDIRQYLPILLKDGYLD